MAFEKFVPSEESGGESGELKNIRAGKRVAVWNRAHQHWNTDALVTMCDWCFQKVSVPCHKVGMLTVQVNTALSIQGLAYHNYPGFVFDVERAVGKRMGLGAVKLSLPRNLGGVYQECGEFLREHLPSDYNPLFFKFLQVMHVISHEMTHIRDTRLFYLDKASRVTSLGEVEYFGRVPGKVRRSKWKDRPCEIEAEHVAHKVILRGMDELAAMYLELKGSINSVS